VTTQEQISPMNQTKTPLAHPVVPRPATGWLRLRPTLRGRGFVVGSVDAAGPDTNGFAPRDRVAWRDAGGELDDLLLMPQNDVLGVPGWITDDQVVSYLGAGLIARALVRAPREISTGRERPFVRGDEVRVVSTDPIVQEMTAAWAKSLGARVVSDGGRWAIEDAPRVRRTVLGTHGKLAQAAVEVFQAIRAGVFDGVRALPAREGRAAA
jgi:hypothetical protein